MELVESYKNYIQLKQTTALTFLFQTMVNLINKTMKLMTWNVQIDAYIETTV